MIYTPQQMKKAILEEAIKYKLEHYRGKGHNKTPHKKMNFNKKRGK